MHRRKKVICKHRMMVIGTLELKASQIPNIGGGINISGAIERGGGHFRVVDRHGHADRETIVLQRLGDVDKIHTIHPLTPIPVLKLEPDAAQELELAVEVS